MNGPSALASRLRAAAEGGVVVPREPTEGMYWAALIAGADEGKKIAPEGYTQADWPRTKFNAEYRAMLAAAQGESRE